MGCPAKDNLQMLGAVLILTLIWLVAVICSAPLFIYRNLTHYTINITVIDFEHTISYCTELWPELPFFGGGVYYSFFSLGLQYFIPILVVSSVYLKIYFRLKSRFVVSQSIPSVDERIQNRRGRRMKRTNCLLISIALIFGISWLPLNIFNLYADLTSAKMTQNVYIIFAVCHMAGMSSGKKSSVTFNISLTTRHPTACSNPLLYGWLNDNFRKEFNEILCCIKLGHNSSAAGLKLKAIDTKKRAYSEVTEIDKQSKLLLGPQDHHVQIQQDLKSEFTL